MPQIALIAHDPQRGPQTENENKYDYEKIAEWANAVGPYHAYIMNPNADIAITGGWDHTVIDDR